MLQGLALEAPEAQGQLAGLPWAGPHEGDRGDDHQRHLESAAAQVQQGVDAALVQQRREPQHQRTWGSMRTGTIWTVLSA